MLALVREIRHDFFGVNLDTGNFRTADPYPDLARLAPYAIVVQVKTEMHRPGGQAVPADLPRLIEMFVGQLPRLRRPRARGQRGPTRGGSSPYRDPGPFDQRLTRRRAIPANRWHPVSTWCRLGCCSHRTPALNADPSFPTRGLPMPVASDVSLPGRGAAWKWLVCGLLMLATMINYMDRLTFNQTAKLIKEDFQLNNEQYGQIEAAFAVAFALGSILVGCMADRFNVWWMYPTAVLAWSVAGFATGLATDFLSLVACRFALGLAEGSNWPFALRTTQRILPPAQRTLGNSLLQSGAAVGAILTPLVVLAVVPSTGTWRYPFMLVGCLGLFWAVLWLLVVRSKDLALPAGNAPASVISTAAALPGGDSLLNLFRDCSPLRPGPRGDLHQHDLALLPCLDAAVPTGGAPLQPRRDQLVHDGLSTSRPTLALSPPGSSVTCWRGAVCRCTAPAARLFRLAFMTTLALTVSSLGTGPLLLGVLLVIGFGALGLFPNYYSFSQELTFRHQGKVTGMLGCACWLAMATLQWLVGKSVDETGSYAIGLGVAGVTPLIALAALLLFWKQPASFQSAPHISDEVPSPVAVLKLTATR